MAAIPMVAASVYESPHVAPEEIQDQSRAEHAASVGMTADLEAKMATAAASASASASQSHARQPSRIKRQRKGTYRDGVAKDRIGSRTRSKVQHDADDSR